MTPTDLAWLAGLLEGEACFTAYRQRRRYVSARITIAMTDRDVIVRVSRLLGNQSVEFRHPPSHQKKGWQPQYRVTLSGLRAEELMRRLLPLMGERRSEKIVFILDRCADYRDLRKKQSQPAL